MEFLDWEDMFDDDDDEEELSDEEEQAANVWSEMHDEVKAHIYHCTFALKALGSNVTAYDPAYFPFNGCLDCIIRESALAAEPFFKWISYDDDNNRRSIEKPRPYGRLVIDWQGNVLRYVNKNLEPIITEQRKFLKMDEDED